MQTLSSTWLACCTATMATRTAMHFDVRMLTCPNDSPMPAPKADYDSFTFRRWALIRVVANSSQLPSGYLRSKADGEKAITSSGCKNWTILRPSVVFGPGDKFLNLFAKLQRIFPVVAVGRAGAQIQPVFLGDVVTAISNVLNNGATHGKHYELAGPEIYTLRELVQLAGRYSGYERKVISLSDKMGLLQAKILQKLPGQLMSVDNFESLAKPSIATEPVAPELGINPTALSVIAPQYLGNQVSRFNEPRERARR